MIRPIAVVGDPVLKQIARDVTPEELPTEPIQNVIRDMIATLKSTTGVGLAAPQISESLRIVIVDKPLTVLVNPVVTPVGDVTDTAMEGCLSVPGMQGEVRRPQTVHVKALDRHGKPIDQTWTKFRAIVLQHEVDHLNGILYIERTVTEPVPDGSQRLPPPPSEKPTAAKQTIVVDSEQPVGGNRHFSFTFAARGRVTGLRIQPGGALVTGAYLSGVKLRQRGYKAGVAEKFLVGEHGLHVSAGDQLRIELQISNGKRRIVAEADVDWS